MRLVSTVVNHYLKQESRGSSLRTINLDKVYKAEFVEIKIYQYAQFITSRAKGLRDAQYLLRQNYMLGFECA
jgi:hypothetical protein